MPFSSPLRGQTLALPAPMIPLQSHDSLKNNSKTTDHGKNFEDADSGKIIRSIYFELNIMRDKFMDSDSKGSNYSSEPAQEIGSHNCCLLEAIIGMHCVKEERTIGKSARCSHRKTAKGTIIEERDAAAAPYASLDSPTAYEAEQIRGRNEKTLRPVSNRSPKSAQLGYCMVILCETCGIKVHEQCFENSPAP